MLEHRREEIRAGTRELLFIQLDLHTTATREAQSMFRCDPRKRRFAPDAHQTFDLTTHGGLTAEVVQAQDLAQRFGPATDAVLVRLGAGIGERAVVEGQLRQEPTELRRSER